MTAPRSAWPRSAEPEQIEELAERVRLVAAEHAALEAVAEVVRRHLACCSCPTQLRAALVGLERARLARESAK